MTCVLCAGSGILEPPHDTPVACVCRVAEPSVRERAKVRAARLFAERGLRDAVLFEQVVLAYEFEELVVIVIAKARAAAGGWT